MYTVCHQLCLKVALLGYKFVCFLNREVLCTLCTVCDDRGLNQECFLKSCTSVFRCWSSLYVYNLPNRHRAHLNLLVNHYVVQCECSMCLKPSWTDRQNQVFAGHKKESDRPARCWHSILRIKKIRRMLKEENQNT